MFGRPGGTSRSPSPSRRPRYPSPLREPESSRSSTEAQSLTFGRPGGTFSRSPSPSRRPRRSMFGRPGGTARTNLSRSPSPSRKPQRSMFDRPSGRRTSSSGQMRNSLLELSESSMMDEGQLRLHSASPATASQSKETRI